MFPEVSKFKPIFIKNELDAGRQLTFRIISFSDALMHLPRFEEARR